MRVATHDDDFHADDVFAIAVLVLAGVATERDIVRTRDEAQLERSDMRVDVGRRYDPSTRDFDHHQPKGAGRRPNGIAFAASGLIWKEYGTAVAGSADAAAAVDERLIQLIDADDNGQTVFAPVPGFESLRPYGLGQLVQAFEPAAGACADEYRRAFFSAVAVARRVLEAQVGVARTQEPVRAHVRRAIESAPSPELIILDEALPWDVVEDVVVADAPAAKFVVRPVSSGLWNVNAVPTRAGTFGPLRRDLPAPWAGRSADDLVAVTGVAGSVFCHRNRYLAKAASRDAALQLAGLALRG